MAFKKTELKIFKHTMGHDSLEESQSQLPQWVCQAHQLAVPGTCVHYYFSVGEKHSRRFRVDTVLEKRGESELGVVPAPHSGLKREKE